MEQSNDLNYRVVLLGARAHALQWYKTWIENDKYHELRNRLMTALSVDMNETLDEFGCLNNPTNPTDTINLESLTRWEQRVAELTQKCREHLPYDQLVKAYQNNNQPEIAKIIPAVFPHVSIKPSDILYIHPEDSRRPSLGIPELVREYISPDEHITTCINILENGIIPQFEVRGDAMSEDVIPVLLSTPEAVTPSLTLSCNPQASGYTVFKMKRGMDARLVYAPHFKAPMTICLQSHDAIVERQRSFFHRRSEKDPLSVFSKKTVKPKIIEDILNKEKQYRDELETRLQTREIPYRLIQLIEAKPKKLGMDKFLDLIFEDCDTDLNESS